eukprot:jgi/Tetstr1/426786/TSEL_017001.t1
MKGVSEIKDSKYKNLIVRPPLAKLRYTMQVHEEADREWFNDHRFNADEKNACVARDSGDKRLEPESSAQHTTATTEHSISANAESPTYTYSGGRR